MSQARAVRPGPWASEALHSEQEVKPQWSPSPTMEPPFEIPTVIGVGRTGSGVQGEIWKDNFNIGHCSNPSKRGWRLKPAESQGKGLSGQALSLLVARFWTHSEEGAARIC